MGIRPTSEDATMDQRRLTLFGTVAVVLLATMTAAAPTTVVLAVDGMT